MAKTSYLVPGVGSGQGLGEEGADVLDFSVSEKEGNGPHEIHDSCEGLPLGRIYYH